MVRHTVAVSSMRKTTSNPIPDLSSLIIPHSLYIIVLHTSLWQIFVRSPSDNRNYTYISTAQVLLRWQRSSSNKVKDGIPTNPATLHMLPIFEWPEGFYTNNNPRFINYNMNAVNDREHGVSHFTGPIRHPSSIILLERIVREILSMRSKIEHRISYCENQPSRNSQILSALHFHDEEEEDLSSRQGLEPNKSELIQED